MNLPVGHELDRADSALVLLEDAHARVLHPDVPDPGRGVVGAGREDVSI